MLRRLHRSSLVKGPLGGSRGWTAVWVLLLGARLLRRLAAREPEVAFSETLRPGQTLVISAAAPDDGDGRGRSRPRT
ncbi:MAG: hypothetical protein ACRDZ9_01165 [Acidimicrobiales bacterium]